MHSYFKYLSWSALALFIYMPFHILLSQWLSTYTGGLEVWKIAKDVFTAGLVTFLVCTVLLTRKYTQLYLIITALAVVYLLLHLLLFATTSQPLETGLLATTYNNRLVWYVLIGYSLVLLMPKTPLPRQFVRVLLVISTIVCLIGLLQWVLPKDVLTHFGYSIERGAKPNFFIDDKPDLPRIFSSLRDPNSLGAFLILPITILAGGLLRFWNSNRRMLLSGLLLMHGLALFLTFSRSAFVGSFLAVGTFLALRYGHTVRRWAPKLALPLVMGLLLVIGGIYLLRDQYVIQNVVFHSDESTQQTDSNNLHAIQIEKGLRGIADRPFGHGPGTAGLVSTKLPNGLLTENYYVQIGYEVGIIGVLLFVAFLYIILRALWHRRRQPVVQALLGSFVGLAFMNMLLHTWSNEAVALGWFMIAGLCLASRKASLRPTNGLL